MELDNTIEGLVHINTLPEGYYEYDGYFSIKDEYSDRAYCAGNRVKIVCAKADVNSGKIDFEIA